jgi:hypothetical protein
MRRCSRVPSCANLKPSAWAAIEPMVVLDEVARCSSIGSRQASFSYLAACSAAMCCCSNWASGHHGTPARKRETA